MYSSVLNLNFISKLILLGGVLFVLVGVFGYFVVLDSQKRLIESQALQVAEIVALQASAARSIYSQEIIGKAKEDGTGYSDIEYHKKIGALPLPTQFMRKLATKASAESQGLYKYRPVSKWNLSSNQSLNIDFLKSAWQELEEQDQEDPKKAIKWKPAFAVQHFEGKESLLYLKADPASGVQCVACHNDYEQTNNVINQRLKQGIKPRKVWKQHQLLGAIFVQIPIESAQSLALIKSTQSIAWIIASLSFGLFLLGLIIIGYTNQAKVSMRKIEWQASNDSLTKLPNRICFEEKTSIVIETAKEKNEAHAMCFLDLDQFKLVNDTCCHAAGDDLLCQISRELETNIASPDILARLGGDEFGVLLHNCSLEDAKIVAQRLCDKIKSFHFVWEDQYFDIGVSIGVVAINSDSENKDTVMRHADIACYEAKDSGKNCVRAYIENDSQILTRKNEMKWVSRIIQALEENRFIIYSQKINSINARVQVVHYEVLVRLLDETGVVISPNEFLPAAERYKLISKIDLTVMDKAFFALKNDYFHALSDSGFISINLSGQSLSDQSFLQKTKLLIEQHKVNTEQICFEITESVAISDPLLVKQFMKELKSMGIRFALDDFGTGLSSLTYLKQFPVDYLKIDGSFVADITKDTTNKTLVDAINKMAHAMDLKTVAEYVESQEILDMLQELNVDYAQGYLLGQPTQVLPA